MGLKMKRKEFDDASDEVFADFCLSSPAFKIRRLDADLPPIIEEDVAGIPWRHEQPIPESAISNGAMNQLNPLDMEELPFVPDNNEKAVVLFKPMNNPLFYSHNNLFLDPNLISSFKNQALLHTHRNATRPSEEADDEADANGDKEGLNTCKAIIPWVPSHQPLHQRPILSPQAEVLDSMESEDMESASIMEIEDAGSASNINQSRLGEGVQQYHQWQQQQHHCMIPKPPHNTCTTTPIVWYR